MRDKIEKITEKELIIVIFLIILVASLFTFISATLLGKTPNVPYVSGITLTYFGNKDNYTLEKIKDYQGVLNTEYYNFSVESSKQKNGIIKYTTYIKELESNTIKPSDIKVYLTDSNNIPQENFRIDVSKIIENNKEKDFAYYDLYTVEIKDIMGDIKATGETKDPKFELYKFYQLNVLNKSLNTPFLVYEDNECLSYNLNNSLEEPTLGETCSIKLLSNEKDYESYKLVSDQDKVLYIIDTTSYKGTYTKIDNNEFKGDIASYINSKRNTKSNTFYIKHITGVKNNSSDKNYSYYTGEVCYEYKIDDRTENYTLSSASQIVPLYKCSDDYKIIDYEAKPLSLGSLDKKYQEEDISLLTNQITNIIDQNYYIYEDSELISEYNSNYYETDFNKQKKRDYRLRYWIDENSKESADNSFNFRINVVSNN